MIQTVWTSTTPAVEVGLALAQQLQQRDRWRNNTTLDWEQTVRNLIHTLDVAIKSQRKEPGAWHLHGALIELMGQDWALTKAGIEHKQHGLVLAETAFPERSQFAARNETTTWVPKNPEWANAEEWERLVRRARRYFPAGPDIAGLTPSYRGMTSALRRAMSGQRRTGRVPGAPAQGG